MIDVPGVHPGEHDQEQTDLQSENCEANGPHAAMPEFAAARRRRFRRRGAVRSYGHAKSSPCALGYPAQAWYGLRFRTGSKLKRCRVVGPSWSSAARWSGVPYPLLWAKPYSGNTRSQDLMAVSRATLARMDAAAIEKHSASPWIRGCCGRSASTRTASINR